MNGHVDFVLGIDPGFTGAIALLYPQGQLMRVVDMPVIKSPRGRTELHLHELAQLLSPPPGSKIAAYLEYVAARPSQSAQSVFRFGQGYGQIQMALAASQIPVTYVTPQKWKKFHGLSSDKDVSRGLAIQKFAQQADLFKRKKDDGRAEASLIGLYGCHQLLQNQGTQP